MSEKKYTPETLEPAIVKYFEEIDEYNKNIDTSKGMKCIPYTISGLCLKLDISMMTWSNYLKKEEYLYSLKKAQLKVMNYVESGILNGAVNVIGGIFNLKNNFGWTDKTEVTVNSEPEKLSSEKVKELIEAKKKLENKTV
jgi:hypothetical protein